MKIVILGLSITSSWGNGHATTYRALVRALVRLGHDVLFLERDQPWYAENRDLPRPPFGRTQLYDSLATLRRRFSAVVRRADCVIVGSYVPEGAAVGEWVLENAGGVAAFYDIDTPVTLAQLEDGSCEYLSSAQIERYSLYLSFTGGPTLRRIEREYGSPLARPLYCSVDPEVYFPERRTRKWALGYLGTFSRDREDAMNRLLLAPAAMSPGESFLVAGSMYPEGIRWPANIFRISHLPPERHRAFYNSQRFTLNLTRRAMVLAGFSPSVRLFEAAACATPIISDRWRGIETLLKPGSEILLAETADDLLDLLRNISPTEAAEIGQRARARVLAEHTSMQRAAQLEHFIREAGGPLAPPRTTTSKAAVPLSACPIPA